MARTKKAGRNRKKSIPKNHPSRSVPARQNINDLLSQAEAAMDASNYMVGLRHYDQISQILQDSISSNSNADSPNNSSDITTATATTTTMEQKILLAKVWSRSGEARVSLGDVERGKDDFTEAISMLQHMDNDDEETSTNPLPMEQLYEIRASVFLYLGQLSCNEDALQSCRNGISDLESCMTSMEKRLNGSHDVSLELAMLDIRKQICSAHCTIAELYLTDLCYESNAESECEKALMIANQHDTLLLTSSQSLSQKQQQLQDRDQGQTPINVSNYCHPDALQALANLRLSQSRGMEASNLMMKSYDRMKVGCIAMSKLVGLEVSPNEINDSSVEEEEPTAKELENVEEATNLPSYEFRCQSAKLLLECGSMLQTIPDMENSNDHQISDMEESTTPATKESCCEAAVQVLGSLLAENDEVIEIWYLMGCAFQALENKETAKQYFERALEMLKKVKEGLEQQDDSNDDDEDDIEQQLEEIDAQIEDTEEKILQLDSSEDMEE